MKIAGIISEYNPFHNGHMRHIAKTREALGQDTGIVCVMSGNFVQRGEPAIFNKHSRAEAAVRCGADLVLELPVPYAVSAAGDFAMGGAALLNSLGSVTHLSFGSENGDVGDIAEVARCLEMQEINALIKKELSLGISYPAARQRAAEKIVGKKAELLSYPNNLLGIEYIAALKRLGSDIVPMTVTRDIPHRGRETGNASAAATDIRRMLRAGIIPENYMPQESADIIIRELQAGRGPVTAADMEGPMLACLRTLPEEKYKLLPGSAEGLEQRVRRFAAFEPGVSEIISAAKTKRYTESRIRRMLMGAYLGIEKGKSRKSPPYGRVLAFNRKGQQLLKEMSGTAGIPLITKPAAVKDLGGEALTLFELEARATDLYSLAYPNKNMRLGGLEWTTSPIRVF